MCIIIYKPKGKELDREILARCANRNNDGRGFAIVHKGNIRLVKTMKNFRKLYVKYKRDYIDTGLEKDIQALWHFRIRTHGLINLENSHPFLCYDGKMVFAHNGVIHIDGRDSRYSDTVLFKRQVLDGLKTNWIKDDTLWRLVTHYIGKTSKVVFINNKGEVKIHNEDDGEWDDGIWYSNSGYKPYKSSWNNITNNTRTRRTSRSNGVNLSEASCETTIYDGDHNGVWPPYCVNNDEEEEVRDPRNYNFSNIENSNASIINSWSRTCNYCNNKLLTAEERGVGACLQCAKTAVANLGVYTTP